MECLEHTFDIHAKVIYSLYNRKAEEWFFICTICGMHRHVSPDGNIFSHFAENMDYEVVLYGM